CAVLGVGVSALPEQCVHYYYGTGAGCVVEEGASAETARRERRILSYCIDYETDQGRSAGLDHPCQQPNEDRGPGHEARGEEQGSMIAATRNCGDGVIQNALLIPARCHFLMYRRGSLFAQDVGGRVLEELKKGLPG